MDLLCDTEVCARKPPWQGLACSWITYITRKSRLEKKLAFSEVSNNAKTGTLEDEVTEFDSGSDKESCASEALVEEESELRNLQITREVDFLIGTTSRFNGPVCSA